MIRERPVECACPCDLCIHSDCHCTPGADGLIGGRAVLLMLGWSAAGLAILGVFLPLLPATPFALVSAWAFARASPRLESWLLSHPRLGPVVENWRRRRAIPLQAKKLAVLSLTISWLSLAIMGLSVMALAGVGLLMLAVAVWILSRKE